MVSAHRRVTALGLPLLLGPASMNQAILALSRKPLALARHAPAATSAWRSSGPDQDSMRARPPWASGAPSFPPRAAPRRSPNRRHQVRALMPLMLRPHRNPRSAASGPRRETGRAGTCRRGLAHTPWRTAPRGPNSPWSAHAEFAAPAVFSRRSSEASQSDASLMTCMVCSGLFPTFLFCRFAFSS